MRHIRQATLDFFSEQSDKAYANHLRAVKLYTESPSEESIEDAVGAYRWLLVADLQLRTAEGK